MGPPRAWRDLALASRCPTSSTDGSGSLVSHGQLRVMCQDCQQTELPLALCSPAWKGPHRVSHSSPWHGQDPTQTSHQSSWLQNPSEPALKHFQGRGSHSLSPGQVPVAAVGLHCFPQPLDVNCSMGCAARL